MSEVAVCWRQGRTWRLPVMRPLQWGAVVYGHDETDVALDQKRHEVKERCSWETRVGWPSLAATAFLIVIGALIMTYLVLDACTGR